jgi:hypothetical protein
MEQNIAYHGEYSFLSYIFCTTGSWTQIFTYAR